MYPPSEPYHYLLKGPVRAGPKEGHGNSQGVGTPLLSRKAERDGVVQPGKEKTPESPYWGLSILKGGL